ncbi:MAG TPA: IPT/TIG domain-containing protein [Bryobacteraceae bacterium]|jgi:uncharacterized protein (TIGR03437 family)
MNSAPRLILLGVTALALCHAQAVITTVAGTGTLGYAGDQGQAINAKLNIPSDMATDSAGNLYIVDRGNNVVRKVDPSGVITTFAGNGKMGYTGDGGPAIAAELFLPVTIAVDSANNVYIGDQGSNGIRKVDTSGMISTYLVFEEASGLTFDSSGNLYVDDHNSFMYKVSPSGTQTTIVDRGFGYAGDNGPALTAKINFPNGMAVDKAGNIYFADSGNNVIRKIDTKGIITTVAGTGSPGFTGDGGLATAAKLGIGLTNPTQGVAVDTAGNLFFADTQNHRVRKVDTLGIITTVVGNGNLLNLGDNGPPASAGLIQPESLRFDSAGNLYIADTGHDRIRKVTGLSGASGGSGPPVISANGVVNGASFQPGIVANSWVTIQGANLAPKTDDWSNSIVNGKLPTVLDGVSVSMGGKPAYIYYISAGQLNVLAPDVTPGSVSVTVTNGGVTSAAVNVAASLYGPAFFPWPGNQPVATRQDYSFAVKAGTFAGATTVPAKPGEVIILWGTGFGATIPAAPSGVAVPGDQAYSTATLPAVTIGNASALVYGAALASGSVGLYQIAIQVPPTLADGDWPIQASIGGVTSPTGAVLTVKR